MIDIKVPRSVNQLVKYIGQMAESAGQYVNRDEVLAEARKWKSYLWVNGSLDRRLWLLQLCGQKEGDYALKMGMVVERIDEGLLHNLLLTQAVCMCQETKEEIGEKPRGAGRLLWQKECNCCLLFRVQLFR